MGVRLDADRDPDQHVLHGSDLLRHRVQPGDLQQGVHHHRTHPGRDTGPELGEGLVVAVQSDPIRGEPSVQGHGQLAPGADVQGEALLGHPAGDLDGEERLRRVVHVLRRAEGSGHLPAAPAEVVLVDDEQRGAVGGRELAHVHPGQGDHAVLAPAGAARPHLDRQLGHRGGRRGAVGTVLGRGHVGVPWTRGVRPHIRSGALTPSRASPVARTCRVAAHRARRAEFSGAGFSSPGGSTRQES